mmetsp:Transcript_8593/g.29499  ORF Transcript_8593/g.29499 Transcript_8593/m.29499 type:complete len:364 (-) Transcript_8593:745-1836(-)
MFWLSPIGEAPPHLLGDNPEAPVGVARLLEVEPARSPEVLFFGHGGVALAKGPAQLRLEHLKVVAQHRGGGPVVIQPGVLVLRHALHVLLQHGDIVRDVLEGKLLYQGIDGKGLDPSWDPDLHSVHQSSGALHLPVVVPVPAGLQDKFALKFVKGAVAELELNLVVGLLQHVKNGLRPEAQVHELLDHDLPELQPARQGLGANRLAVDQIWQDGRQPIVVRQSLPHLHLVRPDVNRRDHSAVHVLVVVKFPEVDPHPPRAARLRGLPPVARRGGSRAPGKGDLRDSQVLVRARALGHPTLARHEALELAQGVRPRDVCVRLDQRLIRKGAQARQLDLLGQGLNVAGDGLPDDMVGDRPRQLRL